MCLNTESAFRKLPNQKIFAQVNVRCSYVITTRADNGKGSNTLTDRAVEVETLVHSDTLLMDFEYYISTVINPPLDRILRLAGANVKDWYNQMHMPAYRRQYQPASISDKRYVLSPSDLYNISRDKYYNATCMQLTLWECPRLNGKTCAICGGQVDPDTGKSRLQYIQFHRSLNFTNKKTEVCHFCREAREDSVYTVANRLRIAQRELCGVMEVCTSCAGASKMAEVACISLDCPVYYSRVRLGKSLQRQDEDTTLALAEIGIE